MTQEERNPPGYFYETETINWVFFGSSAVLLGLVAWMIWLDWRSFRDWKGYQEEFQRISASRMHGDLEAERAKVDAAKVADLDARAKAARKALKEKRGALAKATADLALLTAKAYKADQVYKFAKAEADSIRYEYEEAYAKRGATDPAALGFQRRLGETEAWVGALKKELEAFQADAAVKERERTALVAETEAVEKERESLFQRVSLAERALAKVEDTPVNRLLNAPFMDAVAPTLKINQWVTEDLTEDYNFTRIPKVDRCTTCHLAIDKPGFELQPHPFRTHPRLDLFVGESSKHPAGRSGVGIFGCTVCHGGRPSAVDFTRASHMPGSEEQAHAWEKKYGWHPDLEAHEWERPMLPLAYVQASCFKCHKQEDSLAGAPVLNHGKGLFKRFGCYGCHKTEGFETAPRVAPDLTHLAAKSTPGWAWRWIENPKAFRPDTTMPRFFGQPNMDTDADRQWQNAAIDGAVAYLFHFSGKHRYDPVPDGGDAAKGKTVFQTSGCLGCHTVKEGDRTVGPAEKPRYNVPDLSRIAEKTTPEWLYAWVRDPRHYYPDTRMPDLRLSDEEARDVTAYLATLKESDASHDAPPIHPQATRLVARQFLEGRRTEAELSDPLSFLRIVDEELRKALGPAVLEPCEGALAFAVGDARLAQVEGQKARLPSELSGLYEGRISESDDRRFQADLRAMGRLLPDLGVADAAASLRRAGEGPKAAYRHYEGLALIRPMRDLLATRDLPAMLETVQRRWSEAGLWSPAAEAVFAHLSRRYSEERARLSALPVADRERLFAGHRVLGHFGCAGCHQIPGVDRGFGIGVELTGSQPIGSKSIDRLDFGYAPISHNRQDFFMQKLKEPRIYDLLFEKHGGHLEHAMSFGKRADPKESIGVRYKKTLDKLRMPSFEMGDADARALATFLSGLTRDPIPASFRRPMEGATAAMVEGEKILDRYNCAGCHMLARDRITLESEIADPATGRKARQRFTVAGQYIPPDEEEDEPAAFFKPMTALSVGSLKLEPGAVVDLKALAGLTLEKDGAACVRTGSAEMEGIVAPAAGGHLASVMADLCSGMTPAFDRLKHGPPSLDGEGRKVRPDWLYAFLKEPYEIRPAVWPKMPTFPLTEREARTLSLYFAHRDGLPSPIPPAKLGELAKPEALAARAERVERVRRFFWGATDKDSPNLCTKCHVVGSDGFTPPPAGARTKGEKEAWAPDAGRMEGRLQPEWILSWLRDPQKFIPGTAMPTIPWKEEMESKYGFNEEDVLVFLLHFHQAGRPTGK